MSKLPSLHSKDIKTDFCNWLLHEEQNAVVDPQMFVSTDEAWFFAVGVMSIHKIYKYEVMNILTAFNKCPYSL